MATPRIDAYLSGCQQPVGAFAAPRPGKTVKSVGAGLVREAKNGRVAVAHCFYENNRVEEVLMVAEPLQRIDVVEGAAVAAGQTLGAGAEASSTIDGVPAAVFVAQRLRLWQPVMAPVLLVVDVEAHVAQLVRSGQPVRSWELAHGQAEGVKELRGDLKTPRGLYDVVAKTRGPFGGDYADYYGGVWIKLNYPNAFDAARGLDAGVISVAQASNIAAAWQKKALTPQRTKLGGGIGLHGWVNEWSADAGFGLSWGCLVLHLADVDDVYDALPVGAPVVLL